MRPIDELTQIEVGIRLWADDDKATASIQTCGATEFAAWYGEQARILASVESDMIREDLIATLNRGLGKRKQPIARWRSDVKAFRAAQAERSRPVASAAQGAPIVANFRVASEPDTDGKLRMVRYEVPMGAVIEAMHSATGEWPRTAGGLLFAAKRPDARQVADPSCVQILTAPDVMFAWLRTAGVTVEWTGKEVQSEGRRGGRAPLTRGEAFQGARMLAPHRYIATELLPHWPPMPLIYYATDDLPAGDGSALRDFVALLNPETDKDRSFLEAAILTPGWGGEPGARPGFVFTSEHGVGAGKTATAEAIAEVWGGVVSLQPDDDWQKACERLLSDNALSKRVVLVDNLKGRLSSAAFEGAITSKTVNGRRLYHGDYERPNVLTWFFTVNVAELSRDLAARCIVIRIGAPKHATDFKGAVSAFLAARRYELICDIMTRLRSPACCEIQQKNRDRWQAWQDACLARFKNGNSLAALAVARRPAVDADASEAQDVSDALAEAIRRAGHCPKCARVWIPTRDAMAALAEIHAAKTTEAFKKWLKPLAQQAALSHVDPTERLSGAGMRGVGWFPKTAVGGQRTLLSQGLRCVCPPVPPDEDGQDVEDDCDECDGFSDRDPLRNGEDAKADAYVVHTGSASIGKPVTHVTSVTGRDPNGGWSKEP